MSIAQVQEQCPSCGTPLDIKGPVDFVSDRYDKWLKRHRRCLVPPRGVYLATPGELIDKHRIKSVEAALRILPRIPILNRYFKEC